MKRNIIKFLSFALLLTGISAFTACTDVEAVDLVDPSIQGQNPELYNKYLQNLRAYRATDHVLVYAWFDNSNKTPNSRSEHFTDLPDSIDYVAVTNPENIADWELQEMNTVRSQKGTKFIYNVDFDAIKADYNALLEVATDDEPVNIDFMGYLIQELEKQLSYVEKFNFDGVCIAYKGKSTLHMLPAALKEYKANEKTFFNILSDWHSRQPNALITFFGNPANVIDATLLNDCNVLLVDGTSASSADALTQTIVMCQNDDLAAAQFGMVISSFYVDDENQTIGYFADGSFALDNIADWATANPGGINIHAVGVVGVENDYYNPQQAYSHTRALISAVNPPVK